MVKSVFASPKVLSFVFTVIIVGLVLSNYFISREIKAMVETKSTIKVAPKVVRDTVKTQPVKAANDHPKGASEALPPAPSSQAPLAQEKPTTIIYELPLEDDILVQ